MTIAAEDGKHSICSMYFSDGDGNENEDLANARLIAAAPELLEYLKGYLQDAQQMVIDPESGLHWDWNLTVYNLKNLIAKAEGREV